MTAGSRLVLTRQQILAFRRRTQSLDMRLPGSAASLRRAAWAGLQDSMPRAAVLSVHARVADTTPDVWEDPSLVQLWGPRFSAYVVAADDRAVFTLGRHPDRVAAQERAEDLAVRLAEFLSGERMTYREAGRALGVAPNSLRYATTTGTVLIRWEGAGPPVVWTVPPPVIGPDDARSELARRYLHVFGPATAESFAGWAGLRGPGAAAAFEALDLIEVSTPTGDGFLLADDEADARGARIDPAVARLLPSGDTFFLLWGADRELVVEDPDHRRRLWTSRVWPGAVLVHGEIVGTWRRAQEKVSVEVWRRLGTAERAAIEAEALGLPIPGLDRAITVDWVT